MPKIEIRYSEKAKTVINALAHFDKADFEKWWLERIQTPGSRDVWRYLLERKIVSDDIDNPE